MQPWDRSGQRKTWRRLRADSDTDSHDDSQAASHCHPPSGLDGHLPGSHAAVADAPEAQACGNCGGISDLLEAPLGKLCQDCWADLRPDTIIIGEERITASINHIHRHFLKTVTEDGSLEQFILFDLSHYSPQVKAWLSCYHDDMSAFLDLPNLFPCSWGCYEIRNSRKTGYHGSSTGKPKTQNERWVQAERARHYSKYDNFSLEGIKERRKRNDKGDRYDSNCLFIDMDNKRQTGG